MLSSNSLKKDIILNYIFYFLVSFFSFINTKLFIEFMGNSLYGVWMTISSVVSWVNVGDFGIGNGLRNKIAEYCGSNKHRYIYFLFFESVKFLSKISALIFLFFYLICLFLMWLNVIDASLKNPLIILLLFCTLNMVIGLVRSVAYGCQKSWMTSFAAFIHQLFLFFFVYFLIKYNAIPNLSVMALANGISLAVSNVILFLVLKRSIPFFQKNEGVLKGEKVDFGNITKTGIAFFGLQVCSVILFSTDNLIINYFFSSESVTKYSNISKIYDLGNSVYSVIMISFWSAVTIHFYSNDFKWIIYTIKRLVFVFALYSLGVIVVSLFINPIMNLWMGDNAFYYENGLVLLFAVYSIFTAFSSIFINVLNGLGIIRLQLFFAIVQAVINIPLSIVLSLNFHLGIFGVKLATFLCLLPAIIILPIEMLMLLKKRIKYEHD